jgi:hypothetical protein
VDSKKNPEQVGLDGPHTSCSGGAHVLLHNALRMYVSIIVYCIRI